MQKIFETTLPNNYAVCIHHNCKQADTCLHQLAYRLLVDKENFMRLINPTRCTKEASCPYYRNSQPVTFARGFTGFKKQLSMEQYQKFMNIRTALLGRNVYFKQRKGAVALSPEEQNDIKETLHQLGVYTEVTFDNYEETPRW